MKKRGITAAQPFVYIFMIIVIAFIFLFGYKIITGLQKTEEQATYLTFKNDFNKAVNNVFYYNKDSKLTFSTISKNKPLILPEEVKEVCFSRNTVILKKTENDIYEEFSVDNLIANNLCISSINNRLSFTLTNKVNQEGNTYVEISKNE